MNLPLLIAGLLGCRTTLAPRVPVPDESPVDAWDQLLGKAVDADGYVHYDRIEKKRVVLDRYIAWIARDKAIRGKGGPVAHAFWINAFNALVIYQVLERGRPESVRDVPGLPWKGSGFFFWTDFVIDGRMRMSLWEIGHERVIEAQQSYKDFAVLNVGAASAPPLRGELYDPARLGDQITEQFETWMTDDARGVRVDGDEAVFNPIFDQYAWNLDLFTHQTDLCRIAAFHTTGAKQAQLQALAERGCPHRFFPFDWSLNEADPGRRKRGRGE